MVSSGGDCAGTGCLAFESVVSHFQKHRLNTLQFSAAQVPVPQTPYRRTLIVDQATTNQAAKPDASPAVFRDLPDRYTIQESDDGNFLTCLEMPNIAVIIQHGLSFNASTVRKSPNCRIYLDGVARCEPFMDLEKHVYNFDHHEGVVRPFTIATCEQVLVMVMKGMDLRGRDWKIYANEPDLDTVLSIWLMLNHVRMQQKPPDELRSLYTLIRLESVIDAHGLELIHLSGLPIDILNKTRKIIDYLREEEIDLKRHAVWEESDFLEHTALVLEKIDRLVYRSDEFLDFQDLQELARVEIVNNRVAVAVESPQGIYELEPFLARLYGEKLAIVILRNEAGGYTLRQMDHFMPGDLKSIYRKLNFLDPAVKCRPANPQWGGSGDIGGSPRGIGTQLTPQEIAQACRDVFHTPPLLRRTLRFLYALGAIAVTTGIAVLAGHYLPQTTWIAGNPAAAPFQQTDLVFFLALLLLSALALMIYSRGRFWRVGLAAPIGRAWWFMLPVVVGAAVAGGVAVPWKDMEQLGTGLKIVYAVLTIPLTTELLFRGLAHGILASGTRVQSCGNPWFLSFPTVVTALIYALFPAALILWFEGIPTTAPTFTIARVVLTALAVGIATGMVREKSHSLLPGILFQVVAILVLVFLTGKIF